MEGKLSENNLNNNQHSVLFDEEPGSSTLLISFGGIANRLPIPVFEFMRSLDPFRINKVFIRDFRQCWYTNGIQGITESPAETIVYLRGLIDKYGKDRCLFLGNSAGGYAALLYGHLLGIDETHAFSPQTFIDRWHRLIYFDHRWATEIRNLNRGYGEFFDVKAVMQRSKNMKTAHNIYWDSHHRLDNIHASRITGQNVQHVKMKAGGHAVIKHLRDTGELIPIIEKGVKSKVAK
jgi:hypothetical protein